MAKLTLSAEAAKITGMSFAVVYVDDFTRALEFYVDIIGLERTHEAEKDACFFSIGANKYGLFLAGGARARTTKPEDSHAGFLLLVESAGALHQRLKLNGVRIVQDEPMDRGEGDYWFQFHDPAGNLLEVLGGQ